MIFQVDFIAWVCFLLYNMLIIVLLLAIAFLISQMIPFTLLSQQFSFVCFTNSTKLMNLCLLTITQFNSVLEGFTGMVYVHVMKVRQRHELHISMYTL
jgi:hypothetical protein